MKNQIRAILLVQLLVALLMVSCGVTRNSSSEQTIASLRSSRNLQFEAQAAVALDVQRHAQEQMQAEQTTTRRDYTEPVPEQTVTTTIPMSNLLNLPAGAKYSAQTGRASVEAERQGDKIIVRGKCDSIARRSSYFENRVFRQRTLIDSLAARLDEAADYRTRTDSLLAAMSAAHHADEHTEKSPSMWHRWLLVGFLAGGAVSALLTKTNPLKAFVSLIKRIVLWQRAY